LKDKAITFEQLCHSCGGCELVCPTGAIKEKQIEIGFLDLGTAGDVKFGQGRLKIGDVRSPALIKKVKENAANNGTVIIDVPPGTSCPVVEAVKGTNFVLLVTEPTPFGLNDLELAVGMVRQLKLPFAVAINRSDVGDDGVLQYCDKENIEIILEIPNDRLIAEAYSQGIKIIDALPGYEEKFLQLYEKISTGATVK